MALQKLALTNASGYQLRLAYDASNYADFTVGSGGDLTIAPTGGDLAVTGKLAVTSCVEVGAGGVASVGNIGWNESGVRSWQMGYAASTGNLSIASGDTAGTLAIGVATTFAKLALTVASASGGAGFRLPHGAAPSAPTNGDMWTTTAGLYVRINGATVGPLS